MEQIKIDISRFKVIQYEAIQNTHNSYWSFHFTIGLYDINNKLITTVNFSDNAFPGHKFDMTLEIHDQIKDLLISINDLVLKNHQNIKGGTGVDIDNVL